MTQREKFVDFVRLSNAFSAQGVDFAQSERRIFAHFSMLCGKKSAIFAGSLPAARRRRAMKQRYRAKILLWRNSLRRQNNYRGGKAFEGGGKAVSALLPPVR